MRKRLTPILLIIFVLTITGCENSGSAEPLNRAGDQITENSEQADTEDDVSAEGDNASTDEDEIMAYITDIDNDHISADVIEWVTFPGSRADELGLKEEDAPSGFYIYNRDTLTEQFTLSADCVITVLDWQNLYEPQAISAEKFAAVLQQWGEQNDFIPYSVKITNGTITEIREHYVP